MASQVDVRGVRLVLEVWRTDDNGIAGSLTRQDSGERQRFSGWLELLGLLEAAVA
jgi:hypothetical protein